jgi:DNA-binding NtrC family response regulator
MEKINLVVTDDAKNIRESLKILLEDRYNILEAESGYETLEKIRLGETYLVILDVLMSGMDGIETLEKIKAFNPAVEVCMLTAVSDRETMQRVKELGAFDYVVKPFDIERLKDAVAKMESRVRERGHIRPMGFEKMN